MGPSTAPYVEASGRFSFAYPCERVQRVSLTNATVSFAFASLTMTGVSASATYYCDVEAGEKEYEFSVEVRRCRLTSA